MFNEQVCSILKEASERIPNSTLRLSTTGCPMLVIDKNKALYYMHKTKNYKLFSPWPTHGPQHKRVFNSAIEVRDYLEGVV